MITVTVTQVSKHGRPKRQKTGPAKKLRRAKPHEFEHCGVCGIKKLVMSSSILHNGKRIFFCSKPCASRSDEELLE